MIKKAAILCLFAAAMATSVRAQERDVPKGIPHLDHAFVIVMENHGYQQIHAFVKDCSRKVFRSIGKHLAPEKTGGAAVMNHALFYTSDELPELWFVEIGERQAGSFAGGS